MEVVARGREMIDVAADNAAAFTGLGMPAARRTELADILDQIEATGQTKDAAVQEKVGATAGIDQEIDEGMEAATIVDAMMRNFYRDDPVTLAQWRTARHIKTVSSGGGTPTPP